MARKLDYYKISYWWQDIDYNVTGIAITVIEKFEDEIVGYEEMSEFVKEAYNYGDCQVLTDKQITKPVYDELRKRIEGEE
jgi:NRPS condensation-like uncharacterized protein